MSEELPRPSKSVPIAMLGSIITNGLLGLIFCIVLLYCLGDLTPLLSSATGFPFVQLYYNITNNHVAASIMTLFHAFIALAANSAGLTSTSRTAWAFARDKAFPVSSYYEHLDPRSSLPTRMCILISVLQFLLGLIYLGNSTAFNAIVSMSVLGMYASYVLPIGFMLVYGRRTGASHPVGAYSLGRWGMLIPEFQSLFCCADVLLGSTVNIIALAWGALAMLFSMFPSYQPVNAVNMNYSSLVLGAWSIFGAAYYVARQRGKFEGPAINAHIHR